MPLCQRRPYVILAEEIRARDAAFDDSLAPGATSARCRRHLLRCQEVTACTRIRGRPLRHRQMKIEGSQIFGMLCQIRLETLDAALQVR